jgi:23S rRNA U2552 (ribose-2'-O)-methylase RlmE/FtsJ
MTDNEQTASVPTPPSDAQIQAIVQAVEALPADQQAAVQEFGEDFMADSSHAERKVAQRTSPDPLPLVVSDPAEVHTIAEGVGIPSTALHQQQLPVIGEGIAEVRDGITVEHTLTHEDCTRINAHLVNGYVSPGQVWAVQVIEGRKFIFVGDERVELG